MQCKELKYITLAATVALAVFAIPNAIAVYGQTDKTAVIFLLGDACKPSLYADYVERFASAWIVCADYTDWTEARANLYGFESLYNVVYVTQDNQHPLAEKGVMGEAFYREGEQYAYSINNPIAIAHELEHLVCACHFTPDGRHDFEKDLYPWLWKAEH